MTSIRFRSRFLHATFVADVRTHLAALGWASAPVNFGATPITVIDYQPDERAEKVAINTVSVSLADYTNDSDEELGARGGGLRSAPYSVFVDVYMAEQALSLAICDDVRDIYTDRFVTLINQITGQPVPDTTIEIENVLGPERPSANIGAEQFRKFWRTMRVDATLYYPS